MPDDRKFSVMGDDSDGPLTLRRLQAELAPWSRHNFGDRPAWQPLLGAVEELGELCHSFLKRSQGIRGTEAEHVAAEKDAIGDALVYLADFANARGYDLQGILTDTWAAVSRRDWRKDPVKGG